jgi:O-methyltransferase involved in polyketide biosynthesis
MSGNVEGLASAGSDVQQMPLPRAAARVLAACATSRSLFVDLPFHDALAERFAASLGLDFGLFSAEELRATAFRSLVIDRLARFFFERAPDALGVGVCSLLGTRGHRLDGVRWVDVDVPEVAGLRTQLLPERARWVQVGTCMCSAAWVDAVSSRGKRQLLIVLDESVLPLPGETLMGWLDAICERVSPGSELVITHDAAAPLRAVPPLGNASAAELLVRGADGGYQLARYPRLRFVDDELYPGDLRTAVAGVNAIASLHRGIGAPALAHLRLV